MVTLISMIGGYVRNRFLDESLEFFHIILIERAIYWTSFIAFYAMHENYEEALTLFYEM